MAISTDQRAAGPVIAVDGPAASGKGTIARAMADHFGLPHLDTGMLYRAVALAALEAGVSLDDADAAGMLAASLDPGRLDDPALRAGRTAEAASRVSALKPVRAALIDFQRRFAGQSGGAVLDGRDIGTVIAPGAHAKLFVTAAPEIRAMRRYREHAAGGGEESLAAILAGIEARDRRDSGRADAPLFQAIDADLLDTSDLDICEAVQRAIELVSGRLGRTA